MPAARSCRLLPSYPLLAGLEINGSRLPPVGELLQQRRVADAELDCKQVSGAPPTTRHILLTRAVSRVCVKTTRTSRTLTACLDKIKHHATPHAAPAPHRAPIHRATPPAVAAHHHRDHQQHHGRRLARRLQHVATNDEPPLPTRPVLFVVLRGQLFRQGATGSQAVMEDVAPQATRTARPSQQPVCHSVRRS